MRILFCGGGTAGHVSPAIAMAEILSEKFTDTEVAFVGRDGGEENAAIKKCAYKLYTLRVKGLSGLSFKSLKALLCALKAKRKAKEIIKDFSPDIVIGTGGYVSWPVLRAAQDLKIKTVIHESNAYPGLVTKLLKSRCDLIMLNFEGAKKHLNGKAKIKVIGNPVRVGFSKTTRELARRHLGMKKDEILILSFGGSGGSLVMNKALIELMKNHSQKTRGIRHIHATGRKYYDAVKKDNPELAQEKGRCKILPYLENLPELLPAADIAITRSGAMTLSELAEAKVAAILIPSPNVAQNHQYENAKSFEEAGAAILISEDSLSKNTLLETVLQLERNKELRHSISSKIALFSKTDTKEKLVLAIKELL